MTTRELAFLARVFAAEVEAAVTERPLVRLVQSRSALAKRLADAGYVIEDEIRLGGRFPMTVRGYVLTHLGRMAYCLSCEGAEDTP